MITTLTSVNERTREIGIFRAIGFRSSHIAIIVVLETGMVSIVAGVLGYLTGFVLASLFGAYLAGMQVAIHWSTDILALSVLLSLAMAVLAALYPAIKAAKLDPAEALRFI